MRLNQSTVLLVWRYLLLVAGLAVIVFIFSKAIVTGRSLTYQLDFSQTVGPDITGWYPESRTVFTDDELLLLAEPVYLKVYTPIDFKRLVVEGDVAYAKETVKLGLKQSDGSWQYQSIDGEHFLLGYDLANVEPARNQLEFIISVPDLSTTTISLKNNWRLILER